MKRTSLLALPVVLGLALVVVRASNALPIINPNPAPSVGPITIHPIPRPSPAATPATTPGFWQIHPRNVPDQCLQYLVEQTGTNPTGTPIYKIYAMVATCSERSTLHIAYTDGRPWGGADGDVIIANESPAIGTNTVGCLENPLRMPAPAPVDPVGSDGIRAQWYACATGGGPDPAAQKFYFNTGASGLSGPFSIDTSIEYALGYPNPKLESLNEYSPEDLRFEPYSGLRNWYATPAAAPPGQG